MRRGLHLTIPVTLMAVAFALSCGGGDKATPDTISADTFPVPKEPFGTVCTNLGEKCAVKDKYGYDLYCIALTGSISGKGFCSRKCSDVGNECSLVPNGQMSECFIEAGTSDDSGPGTKYCGFFCKKASGTYHCPPDIQCDKANSSGTAVCKPLK